MNATIRLGITKEKKNSLVALKLDISKAYDRAEWDFLKQTMIRLGFAKKLINLIMNCITTSYFSIIINRIPKGKIIPKRGLRQGCPLSPYLFIICADALSNLLIQAERSKLIYGLKFGQHISISHLLFEYDNLIFFFQSLN